MGRARCTCRTARCPTPAPSRSLRRGAQRRPAVALAASSACLEEVCPPPTAARKEVAPLSMIQAGGCRAMRDWAMPPLYELLAAVVGPSDVPIEVGIARVQSGEGRCGVGPPCCGGCAQRNTVTGDGAMESAGVLMSSNALAWRALFPRRRASIARWDCERIELEVGPLAMLCHGQRVRG